MKKGASASLYQTFLRTKEKIGETANTDLYRVIYNGHPFRIYLTKRKASRFDQICCAPGLIESIRSQMPFLCGGFLGDLYPPFREKVFPTKGYGTLFVVRGRPALIQGLDDKNIRSSRNPGDDTCIHVMSWKRFKSFVPFIKTNQDQEASL